MDFARLPFYLCEQLSRRRNTATGSFFGGIAGKVQVWNADTGELLLTLAGHTSAVIDVAFSNDSKRIVSARLAKTVMMWDEETGLEVFRSNTRKSSCASPSARRVIDWSAPVWMASRGCSMRPGGQEIRVLQGEPGEVESIAFAPDGKRLFAWDNIPGRGQFDGQEAKVRAWSLLTGRPTDADTPPPIPPPGPAVSPDGFLRAEEQDYTNVFFTDKRLINPKVNHWLLPDAAE